MLDLEFIKACRKFRDEHTAELHAFNNSCFWYYVKKDSFAVQKITDSYKRFGDSQPALFVLAQLESAFYLSTLQHEEIAAKQNPPQRPERFALFEKMNRSPK